MTAQGRCPSCGAATPRSADNRYRPFCSERCALVDLGAWFGGEHRIPGAEAPAADAGQDEAGDDAEYHRH